MSEYVYKLDETDGLTKTELPKDEFDKMMEYFKEKPTEMDGYPSICLSQLNDHQENMIKLTKKAKKDFLLTFIREEYSNEQR